MKAYNQKQRDADMKSFHHSAKLKTLILAAMERWNPEEMLEMMYEKCCSAVERDDLKSKMIDITSLEGGMFIKIDSMQQKEKLTDFISTEIFPYHNELQNHLFSY